MTAPCSAPGAVNRRVYVDVGMAQAAPGTLRPGIGIVGGGPYAVRNRRSVVGIA